MTQTVSDFFWERLRQWGVRRIFGYPGDGINGLLGALRGDAQGIHLSPEHVALDQEPDEPLHHVRSGVHFMMRHGTDGHRLAADAGPLFRRGASGIHEHGMHRVAQLGEPGHAVRSIQPAAEGEREGSLLHNA